MPSGSPGCMPLLLKKDGALFLLDTGPVKHAICRHYACMDGLANIGHANLAELQNTRELRSKILIKLYAGFPGGSLVLIASFIGCNEVSRIVGM